MAAEGASSELVQVVALLSAGVIAVPLFKRLGLGSVLGYLAAGLVIGPYGVGLFTSPQAILHVAELGVVMFLFVIGLEMQPSRLWSLRGEIFGLGVAQVLICGTLVTGVGIAFGLPPVVAFLAGMGFTLTSTATAIQLLDERGELSTPPGQRVVSILLLEDLAIVPLLIVVALLAPTAETVTAGERWTAIAIALGALVALLAAGRWLLNPMFRILAESRAREVMTAAALLVVLGSALAMQVSGLSMAMGAFLAGVLLSESTFRHQLEADIEPFRGILLGLFFLSVGMALDLAAIGREWPLILGLVVAYMAVKGLGIYAVARVFRANNAEALSRMALMAQGGEFAFVLYAAAASVGLFDARINAVMTTAVIVSMALTPLCVSLLQRFLPEQKPSMDGVDVAADLHGSVLIIGFGRFGQVASQSLLARGIEVSIIDYDTEMIRSAAEFGFKIYYGDGTRLDLLHAAGAGEARAIAICIDNRASTDRIIELAKAEFPHAMLLVRAYDRAHALKLVEEGVDYFIRETFESALKFGEAALRELGVSPEEAAEVAADIRRRDTERFTLEMAGDLRSGSDLLHSNIPRPTPFTTPKRVAKPPEAETDTTASG